MSAYTVQPGDTLSAIAAQHGVTVAEIAAVNGITNVNLITVGHELKIPNRAPIASPSPVLQMRHANSSQISTRDGIQFQGYDYASRLLQRIVLMFSDNDPCETATACPYSKIEPSRLPLASVQPDLPRNSVEYQALLSPNKKERMNFIQSEVSPIIDGANKSTSKPSYIHPVNYDEYYSGECVSLVRALSELGVTGGWQKGQQLNPNSMEGLPDIPFGTPIATFEPLPSSNFYNKYNGSGESESGLMHTGIFLGYIPDESGEIVAISVLDQWQGKPPGVTEYDFDNKLAFHKNAGNYSVIK